MALEGGRGRVRVAIVAVPGPGPPGHAPRQRVERHVPYVVVAVQQEPAQYVHGQDPEPVVPPAGPGVSAHGHDGLDALVQYRVAGVLGRLGVRRHLRQDVAHLLRRVRVVRPEEAEEGQDLDLQERVRDAPDVVVGAVPHAKEVAKELDEGGHEAEEGRPGRGLRLGLGISGLGRAVLVVDDQDARHELHDRDEDAVAPVVEQPHDPVHEVLGHVGALREAPRHGKAGLLPQVRPAARQVLVDLGRQVPAHVGRGQVADGAEGEAGDEPVVRVEVVLERVGREHEDVGLLGEEEHHAQVAYPLLGEVGRGDELHALELAEVRGVP